MLFFAVIFLLPMGLDSSTLSTMTYSQTVLITGGARRIGRALVEHFVHKGWFVVIHFQNSEPEAQELHRQYPQSLLLKANLSLENEVQGIFPYLHDQGIRVDCLINNASTFEQDELLHSNRQDWDHHMEPNFRAPFILSQGFSKQNLDKGCIINMIDYRVWNLTPHFATYTLSKYGLWGMTQALALNLAPRIRVNAIGPGPTLPSSRQTPEMFEAQYLKTPLQIPIHLSDICRTVDFILETPSLTGQMIALDSGSHLGWSFPPAHHSLEE